MEQTQALPNQLILLSIKDDLYAVDLSFINEITVIETQPCQLPMSTPYIKGLIQSRNQVYPLVAFGDLKDVDPEESRVILLSSNERYLALYTERLHNILTCKPEDFTPIEGKQSNETLFPSLSVSTPEGEAQLIDFDLLYNYLTKAAEKLDQPVFS